MRQIIAEAPIAATERALRLVVAATDFTPAAAAAARRAAAIAEAAGAPLALFHAQRSGDPEKARERLRLGAARLRAGSALDVETHLGYGPAPAAIAAFARVASADLVVVGNRQPGFLADLLGLIAIGDRRLAHFMAKSRAGTGARAAARLGAPATAICEYAREVAADVVVLSPGKSWVARAVGGSVSEQVLADPPCDVLLASER